MGNTIINTLREATQELYNMLEVDINFIESLPEEWQKELWETRNRLSATQSLLADQQAKRNKGE